MRPFALVAAAAGLALAQDTPAPPKERIKQAREFAKQGSGVLPQLQPLLNDSDPTVRREAIKAVCDIGSQRSLEPLIAATRDNDEEIQLRAADCLVNFYYPGYYQSGWRAAVRKAGTNVKGRFTDTNDQVVPPTVVARPEVIAALGTLARGGISMDVRANAARGIGVLRGKGALEDLYAALQSRDTAVLIQTLTALQKIKDPSSGERILTRVRDLDDRVQRLAIETLGLLRYRPAIPDIKAIAERPRTRETGEAALFALSQMPDLSTSPLFSRFLDDKNPDLRAAAAEGYGRSKDKSATSALEQRFQAEQKMAPRLAFAFALVSLGQTQPDETAPLRYLVNTLNHRSYREVAQAYLTELLRDQPVRQAVYPLLNSGTADEKSRLATALSASGARDALAPLELLSKDADGAVAKQATDALQVLRGSL